MASNFKLNNKWILWFHDVKSNKWDFDSYEKVQEINDIKDFWITMNNISINIGMYYLMKDGYKPLWDDENNINGYTYTMKCDISETPEIFQSLSCLIISELLNKNKSQIIGLSTSPKITSNIIRIWTTQKISDNDINNNQFIKISEMIEFPNKRK